MISRTRGGVLALAFIPSNGAHAQWLRFREPGVPRTPDDKADLGAPMPMDPTGKPGLSGVWMHETTTPAEMKRLYGSSIDEERARRGGRSSFCSHVSQRRRTAHPPTISYRRCAEDEGYVMAFAHDLGGGNTELVILAAQDFAGEPVARIHLPVRVPLGIHGSWIGDS